MVATNLGSRYDASPSNDPVMVPEVNYDYITLKLISEIDNKIDQLTKILAPILRDSGPESNTVITFCTQLGKELETVAYKLTSLLNRVEL
jgi:hypothetical protein